jgi:hypothetical protein
MTSEGSKTHSKTGGGKARSRASHLVGLAQTGGARVVRSTGIELIAALFLQCLSRVCRPEEHGGEGRCARRRLSE